MVDDVPDKLRRNVIAFSALLLVAAFWGFNLQDVYKLIDTKNTGVSPIRYWAVVIVLQVYLLFRYHLVKATASQLTSIEYALDAITRSHIGMLLPMGSSPEDEKKQNFIRAVSPNMELHAQKHIDANPPIAGRLPYLQITDFKYSFITGLLKFRGAVNYPYSNEIATGAAFHNEVGRVPLNIRFKILKQTISDTVRELFYSANALETLTPYAVALPAFFWSVNRLTTQVIALEPVSTFMNWTIDLIPA